MEEQTNKTRIAEALIIVSILIFIIIILVISNFKTDNSLEISTDYELNNEIVSPNIENNLTNSESINSENIETKVLTDINGKITAQLTNNNSYAIDNFQIYLLLYNSNNELIHIESQRVYDLFPKSTTFTDFYNIPKEYDNCKIFINKDIAYNEYYEKNNNLPNLINQIKYSSNLNDNNVTINVESFPKSLEHIKFWILYYDESNNFLGIEEKYEYLDSVFSSKKNIKLNCYGIWDKQDSTYTNFDHYEIFVSAR